MAQTSELLKAMKEMMASLEDKMDATQEKMDANLREIIEDTREWGKETTACQEEIEVYPEKLEASPEEMESGTEHREVPREHAAVKPVGGLRKWHRGRNLAAERRHKPKEWNRGNCGSRKKLAATTRRAGVARRQGDVVRKNQTRDKFARELRKGRTFRRSRRAQPECNNGIRNRQLQEQLRLRSERTCGRIFGKIGLEIAKRIA
jgi:hypothetical protein